jgi:hypothetical protein
VGVTAEDVVLDQYICPPVLEHCAANEGKPTEHLGEKGEPLEDQWNPQPETLEDDGMQESMGAEGGALDRGIPPTRTPVSPSAEQGRKEESGRNAA